MALAASGCSCSRRSHRLTRLAVFRDATISAGSGQWGAIQTAAPSFGLEVTPINLRDANEIERAVAAFARQANGGLIVTSSGLSIRHRDLIIAQAAQRLNTSFPRCIMPAPLLSVED
jgi:putative ABC transport system substrate-binding protein